MSPGPGGVTDTALQRLPERGKCLWLTCSTLASSDLLPHEMDDGHRDSDTEDG